MMEADIWPWGSPPSSWHCTCKLTSFTFIKLADTGHLLIPSSYLFTNANMIYLYGFIHLQLSGEPAQRHSSGTGHLKADVTSPHHAVILNVSYRLHLWFRFNTIFAYLSSPDQWARLTSGPCGRGWPRRCGGRRCRLLIGRGGPCPDQSEATRPRPQPHHTRSWRWSECGHTRIAAKWKGLWGMRQLGHSGHLLMVSPLAVFPGPLALQGRPLPSLDHHHLRPRRYHERHL